MIRWNLQNASFIIQNFTGGWGVIGSTPAKLPAERWKTSIPNYCQECLAVEYLRLVAEHLCHNLSLEVEYLKLLGILREPSVSSRNTTRASTLTILVGTTDLSTFRRSAHNRTHLTEQAASEFVLLYQKLRQYLYFCTSSLTS